eukprot:Nk52_evm74s221 gene=Nk52_evmTU74s221
MDFVNSDLFAYGAAALVVGLTCLYLLLTKEKPIEASSGADQACRTVEPVIETSAEEAEQVKSIKKKKKSKSKKKKNSVSEAPKFIDSVVRNVPVEDVVCDEEEVEELTQLAFLSGKSKNAKNIVQADKASHKNGKAEDSTKAENSVPFTPQGVDSLLELVSATLVDPSDLQMFIDGLLSLQNGNSWTPAGFKGATVESLRKELDDRNAEFAAQKTVCEATFEKCKEMKTELTNETAKRKAEEAAFEERLFAAKSELSSLSAVLHQTKRDLDEVRHESVNSQRQLEQNVVALQNSRNQAVEAAQCAINEKNAFQQQASRYSAKVGELTSLIDMLETEVNNKETSLGSSQDANRQLQEEVLQLRSMTTTAKMQEDIMNKKLTEMAAEVSRSKAAAETEESAVVLMKDLQSQNRDLENQQKKLKASTADLQTKLVESNCLLESRAREISSLKEEVKELTTKATGTSEVEALTQKLLAEEKAANDMALTLNQEKETLKREVSDLEKQIEELSDNNVLMKDTENEYKSVIERLHGELLSVQEERDSIEKELGEFRSCMNETMQKVKESSESMKSVLAESNSKDEKIAELEKSIEALKEQHAKNLKLASENSNDKSLHESQIQSLKILNQKLLILLREAQKPGKESQRPMPSPLAQAGDM